MRRRVFAILMAFVMLFSAVPTQALARPGGPGSGGTGSYGTDLGWEYADVTPTYSNGSFAGYDLADVSGSSHLGQYVTVTYSDALVNDADSDGKWDEGQTERQDGIITNDSTKTVTVSCAEGYYIDWVVLACGHNSNDDPFQCQTVATDDGMGWQHTTASFTSVTLTMADIYAHANHASSDDAYYLMIEIKPVPSTVYVGYFAGTAGDHVIEAEPVVEDGNLTDGGVHVTNSDYETWYYASSSSDVAQHTVLGISAEAEAEANTYGYSFAGWKLEYFREYSDGSTSNTFSDSTSIGRDNVPEGEVVTLTVNATLTAVWQPLQTIPVTKVWNDNNNQDGLRPDSVIVHLLKNGVNTGNTLTLNTSNNWAGSWTVPSKDENGIDIVWTVSEDIPTGYTAAITGNETDGFVVTNSHNPETVVVNVQKVWNDDNNRDGVRPDSVTVQLYQNGTAYGDAVVLTGNNTWTHQWSGLEKYKSGSVGVENDYTIQEISKDAEEAGYTVTYVEDEQVNLIEVINTREVAKTGLTVTKVWDDNNDQDGKRPDSITVYLHADGDVVRTQTITAADGWKYEFTDLPLNSGRFDSNGNPIPIVYTVTEDPVNGYTVSVNGMTITNTLIPEKTSVTVTKVWEDEENQDGKRPTTITVTLYADGKEVQSEDITVSDNWHYTFADLPKYRDGGVEIKYTVAETSTLPEGYTGSVDGYTITNTYEPEVMDLTVTKVWNDGGNQDGKQPYAVVIALCVNGEPVLIDPNDEHSYKYTVILTDDSLSGTWTGMSVYKNGQRISYSVEEVGYIADEGGEVVWGVPEGYSVDHSYDYVNHKATVTNSYTPETITLNVRKVWNDGSNRAGMRPTQLTLELWKSVDNGNTWTDTGLTATTTDWTATFAELPKYENGVEIQYTVKEQDDCLDADGNAASLAELGYTFDGCVVDGQTATLTNSRETEYVSVTANKTWVDNDDQDGIRPESIIVYLYANGKLCYELDPEKVDAEGNPLPVFHEVTVDANGNWTTSFVNLYKHYNQTEIVYTIVEETVPGYSTEYNKTTDSDGNVTVEVINAHVPEETEVTVTKLWYDNLDQDGIRPSSVKVQLLANGTVVREANITASAGGWTHTFVGLPKFADGKEISYTVTETAVDGYTTSIDGFTITNTHVPETTKITVTKIWDDADNNDGKRPASIELTLYANGVAVDSYTYTDENGSEVTVYGKVTVQADANGDWGYIWENLDKYAGGKEINYTVYETVLDDYVTTGRRDETDHNHVYITNTYTPEQTAVVIQKVWDDDSNRDGVRPESLEVTLYADGVSTGDTKTLNAQGNWYAIWSELPKYDDTRLIVYTVEEADIEGYTQTSSGFGEDGIYRITNSHTPETTEITVFKNWVDNDDQDGLRPDSVTVELYANGSAVDSYTYTDEYGNEVTVEGTVTITPDANGNWSYTFKGLTKHYNLGHEIVYTVKESGVPAGYTSVVGEIENGAITVTNTHTPAVVSITVAKKWNDSNNQDGLRPTSISFELYKTVNGITTLVDTYNIEMGKNWEATISGLPKYEDGFEIVYSVKELAVEGYETSVDGLTITNSRTPSTIDIPVKKVWDDADNQDGKRPYSVIVYLLRNGQTTGKWIELSAENNWEGVFEDLPEYVEGQKISYTVIETNHRLTEDGSLVAGMPNGYSVDYKTVDGVEQIINSYKPEVTFLNVQKRWEDDNNRAGLRPASITVTLYANGEVYGTKELSPANEWDVTFFDLPKYDGTIDADGNPVPIAYTVQETEIGNGYIAPTLENGGYRYNATLNTVFITNKRDNEFVDVTVNKIWEDNNNQDGIRPGSISLTLYANGIKTSTTVTVEPDANGKWSYTFEDLHKHYQGKEIVYSVNETSVDGYTTQIGAITNGTITVTNTHTPEVVDIAVTKVWNDNYDQDGIRPESITVELFKVTGKDAAGAEILEKVAGVAPVVLNASNNGIAGFEDLPKYENGGTEIEYRVVETAYTLNGSAGTGIAPGYEVSDYKETASGVEITNTHTPEVTSLTATKIWDDNNNQDGKRPDTIVFHLLADGKHMGEAYKADVKEAADGTWVYTWNDLPKYASGKQIRYTVYEEPIVFAAASADGTAVLAANGYDASYVRVSQDVNSPDFYQIRVTNTYVPETMDVEVVKIWQDDNNRDGLRPTSIDITLYADDQVCRTAQLTQADDWKYIFKDLPKYRDGGVEIKYTISEDAAIDGYNLDADGKPQAAVAVDDITGLKIMTNVHKVATTGVAVTKIWEDEDNNDGVRPEYIEVTLLADGEPVDGSTVQLSDANRWTHIWTEVNGEPLYVFNQGKEIKYTVVEKQVAGYDGEISDTLIGDNGNYSVTITNTHAVEKRSIGVLKVWDDAENNDGFRPESIQISLYRGETKVESYTDASGKTVSGTVTLSEENDWTYTWHDLYVYTNGQENSYTVKEEAYTNDDQYDTTYSDIVNGVITVTNKHVPLVWEINVNKVWVDNNDAANLRPVTITAQLYKNGVKYGDPIKLYSAIKWTYAVELPMYEDGEKIEWTVKETEVPNWYYVSYDQDTLTIYNTVTATPKTGDSANIGMWMAMLVTSGAAMLLFLLTGDKKKGKYAR